MTDLRTISFTVDLTVVAPADVPALAGWIEAALAAQLDEVQGESVAVSPRDQFRLAVFSKPPTSPLPTATATHLTTLQRLDYRCPWVASCTCGWSFSDSDTDIVIGAMQAHQQETP